MIEFWHPYLGNQIGSPMVTTGFLKVRLQTGYWTIVILKVRLQTGYCTIVI